MRKMMFAAGLVAFAACGEVRDPTDSSDSDPSADVADDAGVSTTCMQAADCGAGYACDVVTHACVAGKLTIDSTGFIIDGPRWWTTVSGPTLTGTFAGASSATVQALVKGNTVVASLQNDTWTVKLPIDSITNVDTPITIQLTDPSGGLVELSQAIAVDTYAPRIALSASRVRDERGDTIDFSAGEPVHTHAGVEVDLAGGGCPSVYKYGYLMDDSPAYGISTTANPLAWQFAITDAQLDDSSKAFRVRTDANQVLINWTALPAPIDGTYRIALNRRGGEYANESFGTRTGKFYIDVRAKDWNGQETVASWCWDHHALAAPLEISDLAKDELFSMGLPTDSAISRLLVGGGAAKGVGIVSQRVVQYTAEPITFSWSLSTGAIQYSRTLFYDYVPKTVNAFFACQRSDGTTDARCINPAPAHSSTALRSESGTVATLISMFVVVLDETTNTIVYSSPRISDFASAKIAGQLPARTPNEPPHKYRFMLVSDSVFGLNVSYVENQGEFDLLGLRYTGTAAVKIGERCVETQYTIGVAGPLCTKADEYWRFGALDRAQLTFDPFTAKLQTGFDGQPASADVYNVPTSAFALPASTWDAGDDDLPGPY